MSRHTHLGKSHIFTNRGPDDEICLRAGPNETLELGGTINIVDLAGNPAGITINGTPLLASGTPGVSSTATLPDADLNHKIARFDGVSGDTIESSDVKIRDDQTIRDAEGVYLTNGSVIRVDGDDSDYMELKADKWILRNASDETVIKYDLGNINIGNNTQDTQIKGNSFSVLEGTTSSFNDDVSFYEKVNIYNNAGTYKTELEVYNGQASDLTFRFPVDAGSSGYILSTDGTGDTSWVENTGSAVTYSNTDTSTFDDSGKNQFYGLRETVGVSSHLTEVQWIDESDVNTFLTDSTAFLGSGIQVTSSYVTMFLFDDDETVGAYDPTGQQQYYDDAGEYMLFGRTMKDAPKSVAFVNYDALGDATYGGDFTGADFDLMYANDKTYNLTTDASGDSPSDLGSNVYKYSYTIPTAIKSNSYVLDVPFTYLKFDTTQENYEDVSDLLLVLETFYLLDADNIQKFFIYDQDGTVINNSIVDASASQASNPTYPLSDDTNTYYINGAEQGWNATISSQRTNIIKSIKCVMDDTNFAIFNNTRKNLINDFQTNLTFATGTVYVAPWEGRFEITVTMAGTTDTEYCIVKQKNDPFNFEYLTSAFKTTATTVTTRLAKGEYVAVMIETPVEGEIISTSSSFVVKALDQELHSYSDEEIIAMIPTNVPSESSDLSDFNTNGVSTADILRYNGSNWVAYTNPKVIVYHDTDLSNVTGDGTVYHIPFNTEVVDNHSAWSTSTNVWTCPSDGYYRVTLSLRFSGTNSSTGIIQLNTSQGAYYLYMGSPTNYDSANAFGHLSSSRDIEFESADTLQVEIAFYNGTKITDITGDELRTSLSIVKIL